MPREQALQWRKAANELLSPNIKTVHALRGREKRESLPDSRIAIHRDKRDIDRSDILLVNDTFETASMIGTSMEVLYAFQNGKLVVVFGKAHANDYWLNYHSHVRLDTLEEASSFILEHYCD